MSKSIKTSLIVGSIFIAIGLVMVIVVGVTNGWQFAAADVESKIYESETDAEITDIDIDFAAGTLEVEFYDGDVIKVEYPQSKKITTEFKITNKTLKIYSIVKWNVRFGWFNRLPTTRVYIPNNMLLGLKLCVNAGTVTIKAGSYRYVDLKMNAGTLTMENINCGTFNVVINAGTVKLTKIESGIFLAELNAGTLKVTRLNCGNIDLNVSAGTAKIGVDGKKSDYSIWTNVSAGSCNVSNQNGTTLNQLKVKVSAGTANISFDN